MHKTTKPNESPAQKIKRLEKELEDERVTNLFLNEVVDILDAEHGTSLRKKYIAKGKKPSKKERAQTSPSL